jgi:probable F420-dependent oxidoreductase
MQIGVVFPQTELAPDVATVRTYAQTVEALGFGHLLIYDHVLGADPALHPGWDRAYDVSTTFHEPMVLFGYLAALTSLELVTGIIVAPQRQTALLAKQAAEIDLLTEGRFRLGVAVGWNEVEYQALGKDFENRGARLDEQIELLRRLWIEPSVSFDGHYEQVQGAGLRPLPIQRPIPLWVGGHSAPGYRRAGRLADGWFPEMHPLSADFDLARRIVEQSAVDAGRDPAALGLQARTTWASEVGEAMAEVAAWQRLGATHLAINTMNAGYRNLDDHLGALTHAAAELGLTGPAPTV